MRLALGCATLIGLGGLMEIARVVERDEQREVLELEPIDECDGS
jgi:hypothetical protein